MWIYVLRDGALAILGIYRDAERAMSDNKSSDWTNDGGGNWHSTALVLTIAAFQSKS